MDFIWRNKGALLVASVLATFLADPEPYINGMVQPTGTLADPVIRKTNWTLVLSLAVTLGCALVAFRWFLTKRGAAVSGRHSQGMDAGALAPRACDQTAWMRRRWSAS